MVITQLDVNNDLHMLTKCMEDNNRPVVSPLSAMKLAMLWPGICLGGYTVAVLWMLVTFSLPNDGSVFNTVDPLFHYIGGNLAASALTMLFALGIGFGLYGPALLYLTIPKEVRDKSILIQSLKKTLLRIGVFFAACNLSLAFVSIFYRDALFGAPFLMVITFLIMQFVFSAELSRYGISAVMSKLSKLARKI